MIIHTEYCFDVFIDILLLSIYIVNMQFVFSALTHHCSQQPEMRFLADSCILTIHMVFTCKYLQIVIIHGTIQNVINPHIEHTEILNSIVPARQRRISAVYPLAHVCVCPMSGKIL